VDTTADKIESGAGDSAHQGRTAYGSARCVIQHHTAQLAAPGRHSFPQSGRRPQPRRSLPIFLGSSVPGATRHFLLKGRCRSAVVSHRQAPIAVRPTDRAPRAPLPEPDRKIALPHSLRRILRRLPAPEGVQKWVWTQFEHQTAHVDLFSARPKTRQGAPAGDEESSPPGMDHFFWTKGRAPTGNIPGKRATGHDKLNPTSN
jgi:hypothetical protein